MYAEAAANAAARSDARTPASCRVAKYIAGIIAVPHSAGITRIIGGAKAAADTVEIDIAEIAAAKD